MYLYNFKFDNDESVENEMTSDAIEDVNVKRDFLILIWADDDNV